MNSARIRTGSGKSAIAAMVLLLMASIAPANPPQDRTRESLLLGLEYYRVGKFREAIEALKDVVARDSTNDQAIAYIGYSYNRLNDRKNAREWMRRRVRLPGQSPSTKAMVLNDIALLYWDEGHVDAVSRISAGDNKPNSLRDARKLLTEGAETAREASAIAPLSAKAFNLLNLISRSLALIETDPESRSAMLATADEALRKAIECYESSPLQQQSSDIFVAPTVFVLASTESGERVRPATTKARPESASGGAGKSDQIVVEVFIGSDGKVRLRRVVRGKGRQAEAALAAVRDWEFEPAQFEGKPIQFIDLITF